MQKEDYPYCPHGAYVGGCGVDYMCFPCEMGDELSPEQEKRHEDSVKEWYAEQDEDGGADSQFWNLPSKVLDGGY